MSKVLKAQKELGEGRKIKFSLLSLPHAHDDLNHGASSMATENEGLESPESTQSQPSAKNHSKERNHLEFSGEKKRSNFKHMMPVIFLVAVFGFSLMIFSLKILEELKSLETASADIHKNFLSQNAKLIELEHSWEEFRMKSLNDITQIINDQEDFMQTAKTSQTALFKVSNNVAGLNSTIMNMENNLQKNQERLNELYSSHLTLQTMVSDMNESVQQIQMKLDTNPTEGVRGKESSVQ